MASELPQFIVLRANSGTMRYVFYLKGEGNSNSLVSADGDNVFNPFAKIQVEPSKTDPRYVHLRFVHTNKYWARGPDNIQQIVPASDQPEEDLSKPTCTLFQPRLNNTTRALSLHHAPTNRRVDIDANASSRNLLFLHTNTSLSHRFNVVDWDTLVYLPTHVAFKGHNNMYVRGLTVQNGPHQQVSADDPNAEETVHEVQQLPNGFVRIRSLLFNRFWSRNSSNWILADNNDPPTERNLQDAFWPVKIEDDTIALRNAGNNRFIRPLTADRRVDCLSADMRNMTAETKFVVEELVLQRDIYNVIYRMEESRIYDEEPFLAGVATVTNMSDKESSLAVTVTYEESSSYSFSSTRSIFAGVESKITAGIPKIMSGFIRITTEVTQTMEWNETKEEKKTVTAENTVAVPPKSRARVSYVGTQGKCSIPFSYTERDKRSTTGDFINKHNIDGIFFGINYYNFQFESMEIEPL